jgi:hypothetical protein
VALRAKFFLLSSSAQILALLRIDFVLVQIRGIVCEEISVGVRTGREYRHLENLYSRVSVPL